MLPPIPDHWLPSIGKETSKQYYRDLAEFVAAQQAAHEVFPPEPDIFNALALTPPEDVKAVILGQDPYHGRGQAHGLAFSVQSGALPPSLKNIYKELQSDLGMTPPKSGDLRPWAKQGVLLLNAALTVRSAEPNSHARKGWETFTDCILEVVNAQPKPVIFVLWGAYAQKKAALVKPPHETLLSAHPSPLSARTGFFGSKPFTKINEFLLRHGRGAIDWRL